MVALFDVNLLIAFLDQQHEKHASATSWFKCNAPSGWASCPITQNGCLRIMSQESYPNPLPVPLVAERLRQAVSSNHHQFWSDDLSLLATDKILSWKKITGSKQITDVYLLALAVKRGGRFVTFDKRINSSVVRGGSKHLLVI
ncbi:MAG: VapC toxin family PIN domain ribonuclease [Gammaproteobacteria bacterium]|nr:VapC toxin family PIN domain ribonuclease [Gammaproteobacteria bacterium]